MALSGECKEHGWSWDPADDMGCPVCYGIELGEQRSIKLLEDNWSKIIRKHSTLTIGTDGLDEFKALIKGENK